MRLLPAFSTSLIALCLTFILTSAYAASLQPSTAQSACAVTPLPFGNSLPGCKSIADVAASNFKSPFEDTIFSSPDAQQINANFITPVADAAVSLFTTYNSDASALASLTESNLCAGNFDGDFEFATDACNNLPLRSDRRYTVFGFSLNVGPLSPFFPACPDPAASDGDFASFCVAVATACDGRPTIALSVSPSLFKCQPFDAILAAGTVGASELLVNGVSLVATSFTFGLSTTSDFRTTFRTFTGRRVTDVTVPGTLYSGGALDISTDALPSVPRFFGFTGEVEKVTHLSGIDANTVSSVIQELSNTPNNIEDVVGRARRIGNNFDFSVLYRGAVDMFFTFSELGKVGQLIPDSEPFTLGEMSAFATTARVTSGAESILPGVHLYARAAPTAIVTQFFRYALQFAGSVLDVLPWTPVRIRASQLADSIDTDGSDFAIGFSTTVTNAQAVFMVRAPVVIDELGFVEITCTIRLVDEDVRCRVRSRFNTRAFVAVGEAVQDGVLWVAREIDDIADDVSRASRRVLTAGLSNVGDATNRFGSAFSERTVSETLQRVREGRVVLNRLGDVGNSVAVWGLETGNTLEDITNTITGDVVSKVRDISDYSADLVFTARRAVGRAQTEFTRSTNTVARAVGCLQSDVGDLLSGRCLLCCGRVNQIQRLVNSFRRDIVRVARSVLNQTKRIVSGRVTDIFAPRGPRWYTKPTTRRDDMTNCPMVEHWERVRRRKKRDRHYHQYDMADEACVESHSEMVDTAMERHKDLSARQRESNSVALKNSAGSTGNLLRRSALTDEGFKCERRLRTDESKEELSPSGGGRSRYVVPLEVTCMTPRILGSGSIGGTMYSTTSVQDVIVENGSVQDLDKIKGELREDAISKLVEIVAYNINRDPN